MYTVNTGGSFYTLGPRFINSEVAQNYDVIFVSAAFLDTALKYDQIEIRVTGPGVGNIMVISDVSYLAGDGIAPTNYYRAHYWGAYLSAIFEFDSPNLAPGLWTDTLVLLYPLDSLVNAGSLQCRFIEVGETFAGFGSHHLSPISIPTVSVSVEWPLSVGGNGNSYQVVQWSYPIPWYSAYKDAESKGGHLAVITSETEQLFVEDLLIDSNSLSGGYWIGLHESHIEGDWHWTTGESLAYDNWYQGQPDNEAYGNRGQILWTKTEQEPNFNRRGEWNDLTEEGTGIAYSDMLNRGYIIEYPLEGYCGDSNHQIPEGDVNKDCRVNLDDLIKVAQDWLVCSFGC